MIYHLKDYMQYAEENNASPAIRAALAAMQDGDTLSLDGGTYPCAADGADVLYYAISNNDAGEKAIVFPLRERKNITIDGGGASLLFRGRVMPFAVDGCENVTIRGLSVDYLSPSYAQPLILAADAESTTLYFDSEECGCRVRNGNFCFYSRREGWECEREDPLVMEFSAVGASCMHPTNASAVPSAYLPPYFPYSGPPKDHGFLGGMYHDVTLEQTAPDTIVMHGALGFVHTPGSRLVMTHATREFPGIFIQNSRGVHLDQIHLYYTTGMGVIAQTSEDLLLTDVTAEVKPGSARVLSVNADATHFVNCRGSLELLRCRFTNMMDDACNIHGIYGIIAEKRDDRTVVITYGHEQQRGVNFFRAGDLAAILEKHTSEAIATCRVVSSQQLSHEQLLVTFAEPVPMTADVMLAENLSTAPKVHIADCVSGYNRPRGFLLSSAGETLIERCTFYNMNAALQIGGEMCDWYESGAVSHVTIRDCAFDNSAYAGGVAIHIEPRLEGIPRAFFHGSIVIENNRFTQANKRILSASLVRSLVFRGNTFHADPNLPGHAAYGDTGIYVHNCGKTEIEPL